MVILLAFAAFLFVVTLLSDMRSSNLHEAARRQLAGALNNTDLDHASDQSSSQGSDGGACHGSVLTEFDVSGGAHILSLDALTRGQL